MNVDPGYLNFLKTLALSAAVGMLIGVEREHVHPEKRVAGFRTFTLTGILGGLTTYTVAGCPLELPTTLAAGTVALVVLLYAMRAYTGRSLGLATPTALLVTYAAGGLIGAGRVQEGATLAVVTAVLLLSRSRIHPVLRRLSDKDVLDAVTVFALAALAYPLCPPRPVDPWGVLNLRKVIETVLLVLAVTALGYLGMRTSVKGGVLTTSVVGGFVSSSVTTATVAARFKDVPQVPATVTPAATSVALLRNLALVAAVSGDITVVKKTAHVTLPAAIVGLATAVHVSRNMDVDEEHLRRAVGKRIRSPLSLKPAAKLGLLIVGFSTFLKIGQLLAGRAGLIVGVIAGSLASSNAMSISLAYMVDSGALDPNTAGTLVALASLEAVLVKYLWTGVFGGLTVLERTYRTLLPQTVAGAVGLAVTLITDPG